MAQLVTYVDDFNSDATDNVEVVRVRITKGDRTLFIGTADLGDESTEKGVLKPLGKFRAIATDLTPKNGESAKDSQDEQIRAWARDHGFEVKTRGRIPGNAREAYFAAHSDEVDHANDAPESADA